MTYPYDAPASDALMARARAVIPGGVNSPVRAFRAVGGTPRFMTSGHGPYVVDADGREYVDLVCSWGPLLLGHAHPAVLEAVQAAVSRGTSFGTPTEGEVALAEEIVSRVDPVEQVRLVSSGTEATMSAIRLARGFTGRTKVVKFAGCYHGHVDSLLAAAGSGVATLGLPQVNPVNEEMRRRLARSFGSGYDYAYLYPGIRKVVQAAGRVIRTREDRGTVVLIDDRFARPEVRALLPGWWQVQLEA